MLPRSAFSLAVLVLAGCATAKSESLEVGQADASRQRVVGIRVMTVDVPPQSPLTSSEGILSRDMPDAPPDQLVSFLIAERDRLLLDIALVPEGRLHASMRMEVTTDATQQAESGNSESPVHVEVRVLPTAPGTVEAWVAYREGDRYQLPPTWVRFDEGQGLVLKVHGQQPTDRDRTL